MTTDPKNQKPGPGFEQDLETLRSAWSNMDQAEPPELLDQAILNSAARALEGQPLPWWKKRPLHWAGAAATAMVLVLTITLVVQQDPMAPAMLEQDSVTPAPAMLEQDELKQDRDDSALGNKSEVSADAVEFRRERPAEELGRSQEIADPAAKMAKRSAAPVPAPPQASLAASPVLEEEVTDRPVELPITTGSITSADDWVKQLLELKAEGKQQELKEQLAAFREAYPDYALPTGLQD